MEALRIYFKLIGISFQSRMQFRTDFLIGVFGVIVLNATSLATIGVILNRFEHLNTWTFWQVVFLYCLWLLGHTIISLLFWHMDELEFYIIQGTFDQFLVRPISPFVQFLGREVNYVGVADLLVAATGMALALRNLDLRWSLGLWLFFALVVISAALIEFSIMLALSSIAFWTGRSAATVNTVFRFSFMIQQYPVDMFGRWFRVFVTAVVPVAFMNYYPALLLLGKLTPGDPWAWLSYISPLVAMALLFVASIAWRQGIRHYSGAGN